jgi:hypothetical protein
MMQRNLNAGREKYIQRSMAAEVRKGQLTADFGKAAVDYGKHRAGFPVELFDRLAAMILYNPGRGHSIWEREQGRSRVVSRSAGVNRLV